MYFYVYVCDRLCICGHAVSSLQVVLNTIATFRPCVGNPDPTFLGLSNIRHAVLMDHSSKYIRILYMYMFEQSCTCMCIYVHDNSVHVFCYLLKYIYIYIYIPVTVMYLHIHDNSVHIFRYSTVLVC